MKVINQFLKFCLVGLSNTIITYGFYYALTFLGFPYVVANTIGFFIGMVNAFYWNNKFVFKIQEKRNIFITFIKMILVYSSTGIILSNILLYVFIEKIQLSKYIAPAIILTITIPLNFILNKFWCFKTNNGRLNNDTENNNSHGSNI